MAREAFQTLSEPMYYVLLSLTEERYGAQIMEQVKALSHGRIAVGPGTLYMMLSRFLEWGFITETAVFGRRKSYLITKTGEDMLREEYRRLQQLLEDGKMVLQQLGQGLPTPAEIGERSGMLNEKEISAAAQSV